MPILCQNFIIKNYKISNRYQGDGILFKDQNQYFY